MKIVEPNTAEEYKNYYKVRWEILRKPWDYPEGSEIDDQENISLHAMATENGQIMGVGRLTYFPTGDGQVRFMGVKDEFQKQNIGSSILDYLEEKAREMGLKKIWLNARQEAYQFYLKKGYKATGKPFDGFADIAHTKMVKDLD